MRFPRLVLLFASLCAVGSVLSGCGSASLMGGSSSGSSAAAPAVVATGVQDNGVAPNRWQYVQFNEAMDRATINAQTFVVTDSGGNAVPGNVSYDASFEVAGFQPNPPLQTNASYAVTISTGVANTQGVHMAKPYTYNFTTRASTDTSPLYVASVKPDPNATCVSATSPITITFSEGVEVSTLTSANIGITGPGNAIIQAKISYDISTAVATLTPAAPLPSGTITVSLKNVADAGGVAMTKPYGWTFDTTCTSGSAVAYVYVSSAKPSTTGGVNAPSEVVAYAADANGHLTPVPGSPFNDAVGSLAVNGTYLMAVAVPPPSGSPSVNSYKIGSDGSISLAAQTNLGQFDKGCVSSASVVFDRTGRSLYANESNIDCATNVGIASFAVDPSSGTLSYLGDLVQGYRVSSLLPHSFLGNDVYAYSGFVDCMYGNTSAFQRSSSGLLGYANASIKPPAPPPGSSGSFINRYVEGAATADSSNHVVFAEYPCFSQSGSTPPVQLATYTADASGNLTTTDTYATMPSTPALRGPFDTLEISPAGNLLAVGGYGGLQVFHYNAASPTPITSFSGVLTTDVINRIGWDNNNHLYATTGDGQSGSSVTNANKLYVFTVTDTGVTQAPGSPHTITFPADLAVQPK